MGLFLGELGSYLGYDLPCKEGSDAPGIFDGMPRAESVQVTGRIRVSRSRGVHRCGGTHHRDGIYGAAVRDVGTFLAVLHNGGLAQFSHGTATFVGIVVVEHDARFLTVGEDNVAVIADKVEEFLPIAADGEGVRDVERHQRAVLLGDGERTHDGVLLALGVPHIAGEMEDVGVLDGGSDDVLFLVFPVGAEEGVHAPLRVWGDQDDGRTCGHLIGVGKFVGDPELLDPLAIDDTVLVGAHFSGKGRLDAEGGHRDDGVRTGTSAGILGILLLCERKQLRMPGLVDQRHGAFVDAEGHKILILRTNDDVDERIANSIDSGIRRMFHAVMISCFPAWGNRRNGLRLRFPQGRVETEGAMSSYTIVGGKPATGEVLISGNKNAALACLAATLLTDKPVRLSRVPEIEDVAVMMKLLASLGSSIKKEGLNTFVIQSGERNGELQHRLVDAVRGSILLAGPLLATTGEVELPPPGGDVIGLRRLDTHFLGLSSLGATCILEETDTLHIKRTGASLHGADVFLDETSVTATENIIMASSLAEGTTVIRNAASEPHVEGIGSNVLRIDGRKSLAGCSFELGFDYMEAGSFIGLAGASGGELLLRGVDPSQLRMIRLGFQRIGIDFYPDGPTSVLVPRCQQRSIQKEVGGHTSKIDDAPWPGFPADLLSIITVCATQMRGTILIHEKMYESRMFFIDWLIRMGADIILCDPHRAIVSGPSSLHAAEVSSPDVRAGMALVIAAVCAKGTTTIGNIYQIERGYEQLQRKLTALGLSIKVSS
jgi:UDP-N-acetylglucosamine 1-carboxyvinyltransferase